VPGGSGTKRKQAGHTSTSLVCILYHINYEDCYWNSASFSEEDWDSDEEFFKALGSKDSVIKAADELDDDDIVRKLDQSILLFQSVQKLPKR
jgi:hypothetical protein